MIILHIGLLDHFTEGMFYQDNILPKYNIEDGHDVVFITDSYKFVNGKLIYTGEEDRMINNHFRLIRLDYDFILSSFITKKIQKVSKLKNYLESIHPNVILYHNICGYELMDVADYVKKNPSTLFYADSHTSFVNSAKNIFSKFAYKYIHGIFVKKALPYIKKVLYVGYDSKEYLQEMYNIPEKQMEFFPMGGIITTEEEQIADRKQFISENNLPTDSKIFMHSGKLDSGKKTANLIRAFKNINDEKSYLFIFGSIPDDQYKILSELIDSDRRVVFLGWKTGDEISFLLNAADVYCQPGTYSATSQMALCCGCAEIVYPYDNYKFFYKENVLYAEDDDSLKDALEILTVQKNLSAYKKKGYKFAKKYLDYRIISRRYLK